MALRHVYRKVLENGWREVWIYKGYIGDNPHLKEVVNGYKFGVPQYETIGDVWLIYLKQIGSSMTHRVVRPILAISELCKLLESREYIEQEPPTKEQMQEIDKFKEGTEGLPLMGMSDSQINTMNRKVVYESKERIKKDSPIVDTTDILAL